MLEPGAIFDSFVAASTFKTIQQTFHQLCISLDIDPTESRDVYRRLRELNEWKAQKLWKLLDKRYEQPEYKKQTAAERLRVLVIGAGPCGLRMAIECALLGARVVLVEQRDRFSRNNVLHLWEFVIHDLRALGAKIFYPKFCTGSIEHISIRQLQCILLKIALCFGVQVHESVSFVELVNPTRLGNRVTDFRARLEPRDHILSQFEFDVLIGADGKRNTVQGFAREEMRGRLAIGITANFVNKKTPEEERVPEISGVAYIFNQAFFKEMVATTGCDLENIVYYKDETHYFVMCAKKQSLMDMGVIKKDYDDAQRLLHPNNVDLDSLSNYAKAAANFATNGKLPALDFARNHKQTEDIAMFDFTSLYSSKHAVKVVEIEGRRLLIGIVGDSLHEPFWPTGSGCGRGFLGVLDTAWLIREYGLNKTGLLEMIAERESIYRLLAQVTKDNMHKTMSKYTIDPRTRYVSLEMTLRPHDVTTLAVSDKPTRVPLEPLPLNQQACAHDTQTYPHLRLYKLLRFCQQYLASYKLKIIDLDKSWWDGRALAGMISRFAPDALDHGAVMAETSDTARIEKAMGCIESVLSVRRPCSAWEWRALALEQKTSYLDSIVNGIRGDRERLCRSILQPTGPVAVAPKRSRPIINTQPAKKSAIEKLTANILRCSSFKANEDPSRQERTKAAKDDVRRRHEERLAQLAKNADEKFLRQEEQSGRAVERLNPQLVDMVEKIYTGEADNDKWSLKDDLARYKAGKIDREKTVRLEEKLKNTAGGGPEKTEYLSSQDEKIMRVNAADARKEAMTGFQKPAVVEKFKPYDDVIQRSTDLVKRRDLNNVDPFGRAAEPVRHSIHDPSQLLKQHSIDSPALTRISEKPMVTVPPKRHSQPSNEGFDTVNARRQNDCYLCNKVVYLAERMQVESMFIHKNCFRCAYCNQPLRLSDYGKDKDLEYYFPNKFFCHIHLRVPLREKIAKIERLARRPERAASREDTATNAPLASNALRVAASPPHAPSPPAPPLPHRPPPLDVSGEALVKMTTTLSYYSPDTFAAKASDHVLENRAFSPVSETKLDTRTPERAEFGLHIRKSSVATHLPEKAEHLVIEESSESDEDEDEVLQSIVVNSSSTENSESESKEDGDESLDQDFDESDIDEMEKTVYEIDNTDPSHPFTDKDLLTIVDNVNRRRTSAHPPQTPPNVRQPEEDTDVFYTPAVTFREVRRAQAARSRAATVAVMDDKGLTQTQRSDSDEDIRKQKTEQLERIRLESREKAKMKTDAELGLGGSLGSLVSDRRSVPVQNLATPLPRTGHLSPIERKPRAQSMLESMPSVVREREMEALRLFALPGSPPHHAQPVTVSVDDQAIWNKNAAGGTRGGQTKGSRSPTKQPGLLERFFRSPVSSRNSQPRLDGGEKLKCESKKETNMLNNAILRRKRESKDAPTRTPSTGLTAVAVDLTTKEVPYAAVAPSPRLKADTTNQHDCADAVSSPTTISVDDRTLRKLRERAEKIRRQRAEETYRQLQELQRSLDEKETRLEEVMTLGALRENKLALKPTDRFELDYWLSLWREREGLEGAIAHGRRKIRKAQLEAEYKELNLRFKHLSGSESEEEELLNKMMAVLSKKKALEKEEAACIDKKNMECIQIEKRLLEKGYDFRKYRPVFVQ